MSNGAILKLERQFIKPIPEIEAKRIEARLTRETREKEFGAQFEKERKALAAKKQFIFDGLLIQRQKGSTKFLLPNENLKKVTAYNIIKRLSGKAFKSYKKHIKFINSKIQILPYAERIRIVFYFRKLFKMPPILENAETIAAFINTANKYTNNIQLNQNWQTCLNLTRTKEEAASLLVYYGWAADYKNDFPRLENVFYTVDVKDNARHYNILNDNVSLRFAAIENEGSGFEARLIIKNENWNYEYKYNKLQELLKPLLWYRDKVKMGLIKEDYILCNKRVNEYIEKLLEFNVLEFNILKEVEIDELIDKHIDKVEIDKSDTGIIFAKPQEFVISFDDMEFLDYTYNITAEYNKENAAKLAAGRSKKAADENFKQVIGNKWTTQELKVQGIDKDKIPRLIDNKLIKRTKRGFYERI